MTEETLHQALLWGWYGLSACVFALLLWMSAPYGRHERTGWGPRIPSTLGWLLMELPAVVVPVLCFVFAGPRSPGVAVFALVLWEAHYLQRTFVYPFRMRMAGKSMPLLIAATAFVTNVFVNYLVFRWLFAFAPPGDANWWWSPNVLLGTVLFVAGYAINRHSDEILRSLRRPGETGYRVPEGGLYRYLSCPNYFGELLQWTGFALVGNHPATWVFLAWSGANLVPRALENHRWYQRTFPAYPPDRRALVPFVL